MTGGRRAWIQTELASAFRDGELHASRAVDQNLPPEEREEAGYLGWAAIFDLLQLFGQYALAWADECRIDRGDR